MKVFPITIIGLTILPVFAGGCADRLADKRAAIAELIGKEVVIPENIIYRVQDIPIDNPLESADYRIVTYIDSTVVLHVA